MGILRGEALKFGLLAMIISAAYRMARADAGILAK